MNVSEIYMYKTIVPNLVSVDTSIAQMKGLHFFQGFAFFSETGTPLPFHYRIVLKKKIDMPSEYDFRNGYYTRKGKFWFFERTVLGQTIQFSYDAGARTFYVNKVYYRTIRFVIGGIIPPLNLIVSIILLDLFLAGYVAMSGFALQIDKKVVCVTAPSFNGKTEFLKKMLRERRDIVYIAEDSLIIDYKKFTVFPTAPAQKNFLFGRKNMDDKHFSPYPNTHIEKNIDRFLLWQNSTAKQGDITKKGILDFLWLNSLTFLNSIFIRSYVFENNLTNHLTQGMSELRLIDDKCMFMNTYNYNLDIEGYDG